VSLEPKRTYGKKLTSLGPGRRTIPHHLLG
jgi:hypothetical protein